MNFNELKPEHLVYHFVRVNYRGTFEEVPVVIRRKVSDVKIYFQYLNGDPALYQCYLDNLGPIPISYRWLLILGFENNEFGSIPDELKTKHWVNFWFRNTSNGGMESKTSKYTSLYPFESITFVRGENYPDENLVIRYIHELQNHYSVQTAGNVLTV